MATTVIDCGYINPGADEGLENLVHTGQGRLLGFLMSNNDTVDQTVTFYDATTNTSGKEFLMLRLPTGMQPIYFMFPRQQCPTFQTGLYVDDGGALVAIWAVLYS